MEKIIITGGNGRFAKILKRNFKGKNIHYFNKKEFNIMSKKSMEDKIKLIKPNLILHLAALSRPISIHDKKISKSIDVNILGTCNLVKVCEKKSIKLVYMSTHYVYPCIKGNYNEKDGLLPASNYAWSKLGGECAVQMYLKNSLILRVAMYESPFPYEYAYTNIKSSFLSHQDVAKILPKLLKKKGVLNLGGKRRSIYNFAKVSNKNVKPSVFKANTNKHNVLKDSSVNINKLKSIIGSKIII